MELEFLVRKVFKEKVFMRFMGELITIVDVGDSENILRDRIRSLKNESHSNCFGTALYLLGMQNKDEFNEGLELRGKRLRRVFQHISTPVYGALALWTIKSSVFDYQDLTHAGIVTGISPTLVTHRDGMGARIRIDDLIYEIRIHRDGGIDFYVKKENYKVI